MFKKKISPDEFEKIYSRVPRLCVDLVVKFNGGVVLALRSLPSWHNQWHLPGGTVYLGESVIQAAERIAQEELGIRIKIIKPLGFIEFLNEAKERGFGQSLSIPLLCDYESGNLRPDEGAYELKSFLEIPTNTITEQAEFLKIHWSEVID